MKIVIDEKACKKHKMTVPEVLYALAIRAGLTGNDVQEMLNKEILIEGQDSWYMVTQHWSDTLDEILADSASTGERTDEELMELAKKMRAAYPEGKMPGTAYFYRCNNREVVQKLKKFFTTYGIYTDEQIVEATERFVKSFCGEYKYLPLIKYFISKQKPVQEEDGTVHNVEYSPLADYLENEGEDNINHNDWTIKLV